MGAAEDSGQDGHQHWLKSLHAARENCRNKVAEAVVGVEDPNRALWPRLPRQSMTPQQRAAISAHVAVIDYSDQIRPLCGELQPLNGDSDTTLWTKPIDSIEIGEKNIPVSLENLEDIELREVQIAEHAEDELRGKTLDSRTMNIVLPVSSSRKCYRLMNQIVYDLGLGAEIPMQDYKEVDPI